MLSEVVTAKPAICPKCGMALEPRASMAEMSEESPHVRDLRRRSFVSLARTIPIIALSVAAPPVLWSGIPFYRSAWAGAQARSTNMYMLITYGVAAASRRSLAPRVHDPSQPHRPFCHPRKPFPGVSLKHAMCPDSLRTVLSSLRPSAGSRDRFRRHELQFSFRRAEQSAPPQGTTLVPVSSPGLFSVLSFSTRVPP